MNTVVLSENYRLKRSKEVWTMAGLLIALQGLLVVLGFLSRYISFLKPLGESLGHGGFFTGFTGTASDMLFHILIIIMISSLVTKLYQTGVCKQLSSSGITRNNVILGQFVSFTAVFSVVAIIGSLATGLGNVILGGGLGLEGVNFARLGLSFVGMILVVASLCAMYLLIAHLTGSMGAAMVLGLAIEIALPNVISMAGAFLEWDFLSKYFINNIQYEAVSMESSLGTQLMNMGLLAVITVVLVVLCQVVFKHKEVK